MRYGLAAAALALFAAIGAAAIGLLVWNGLKVWALLSLMVEGWNG